MVPCNILKYGIYMINSGSFTVFCALFSKCPSYMVLGTGKYMVQIITWSRCIGYYLVLVCTWSRLLLGPDVYLSRLFTGTGRVLLGSGGFVT